jgi:hypothetical protein
MLKINFFDIWLNNNYPAAVEIHYKGIQIMMIKPTSIVYLFIFATIGCNANNIGNPENTGPIQIESDGKDDATDSDSEAAVRPVNITGTFLACHQGVYEKAIAVGYSDLGCGFYDSEGGKRVDVSQMGNQIDWGYESPDDTRIEIISGSTENRYDVYFVFSVDTNSLEKVVSDMTIFYDIILKDGRSMRAESSDFIKNASRVQESVLNNKTRVWGFSAIKVPGENQVDLNWNKLPKVNYLVLYKEGAEISWKPEKLTRYEENMVVSDAEIIYVGDANVFSHQLSSGAAVSHHYTIYAFDDALQYSSATHVSLEPETDLPAAPTVNTFTVRVFVFNCDRWSLYRIVENNREFVESGSNVTRPQLNVNESYIIEGRRPFGKTDCRPSDPVRFGKGDYLPGSFHEVTVSCSGDCL